MKGRAVLKSLPLVLLSVSAFPTAAVEIDASWRIVVPPKEDSGVQRALKDMADELASAFEEGSGFRPGVDEDGEVGPKRIFLGRAFAEAAGFDLSSFKAMDNAYAEKDGAVYFFGDDRSGKPNVKNVTWQNMYLPSAKAAARFMKDTMGVRYLMPGRIGRDVPKRAQVTVKDGTFSVQRPPFDFCYAPKFDMAYSVANGTLMRGTYHSFGGHTWPVAFGPEVFREHPEYFALVGGRRLYGSGGHRGSLCISNPECEKALIRVLLEKFDEGVDCVQLAQMDGWNFCECEKCNLGGGLKNAQAIADRVWAYHLGIAEKIRTLRPGKKVWIISYSATFDPPTNVRKFPDNVVVEVAHVSEEQFARWREIEVPGGFTAYVYLWGNYPFMGFTAKRSYRYNADFAKMLLRNRVHGLYRCGYGELFGMEGPANWVFNGIIENPEADVNALVDEYCRAAFGPAAANMRVFYDVLDKGLRAVNAWEGLNDTGAWGEKPGDLTDAKPRNALDWIAQVYTADAMKRMDNALEAAERTVTDDPKVRKRLELVRSEWNYARNLGRIAHLYQAYQILPSKTSLSPLLDEIEKRNAMIDALYDDKGKMKPFPGWPEIHPFGNEKDKRTLRTNGRLRATIGAPLGWDVAALRASETLPGAARKTAVFRFTEQEPDFDDFDKGEWTKSRWQALGGIQGEKTAVRARFKILAGHEALYLAAESDLADDVRTEAFKADGPCWRDESFDLTIAPNGSRAKVYHLIWNPADGSFYDEAYGLAEDPLDPMYGKFNPEWNGAWKIRNERKDGTWRTMVTIPYGSIGAKGGVGSKWYCNLGRSANMRPSRREQQLLLWNPDLETRSLVSIDAMGFFRIDK